jgi:hypothetical protein
MGVDIVIASVVQVAALQVAVGAGQGAGMSHVPIMLQVRRRPTSMHSLDPGRHTLHRVPLHPCSQGTGMPHVLSAAHVRCDWPSHMV